MRITIAPSATRTSDDSGAIALIVALTLTVVFALAAVAVDAGPAYIERARLQTASDAAVLAGVAALPADPVLATARAEEYIEKNAPEADELSVSVASTYVTNDTIRVEAGDAEVEAMFGRILGFGSFSPSARAVAIVSSPRSYARGVMPFGVMARNEDAAGPFGYAFNEPLQLKQSDGEQGNFHLVALTSPPGGNVGASTVTSQIRQGGASVPVRIGDLESPRTGMNGSQITNSLRAAIGSDSCTFSQVAQMHEDGTVTMVDPDCPRVIVCPLIVDPGPPRTYNWGELNGSSGLVEVVGFAYFFVDDVGTNGNLCTISGRFIRPLSAEEVLAWGPIDPYGVVAARLVE